MGGVCLVVRAVISILLVVQFDDRRHPQRRLQGSKEGDVAVHREATLASKLGMGWTRWRLLPNRR